MLRPLILLCLLQQSTYAREAPCLSNTEVCLQCPSHRRTTSATVISCCPGCSQVRLTAAPHTGAVPYCSCPLSGHNTSEEVQGKVVSGGGRPHLTNSIVNRPSFGPAGAAGPINANQFHAAMSVLADAIESLAGRLERLEQRLDDLHRQGDEALQLSESSINRVGVVNKKDKTKPPQKKPTTTPSEPSAPPCLPRYERLGQRCYYFSVKDYQRRVWQEANDDCIARGGKLANLESSTDRETLSKHLASSSSTSAYNVWLGGLYPGVKWLWVDTANKVPLTRSLWTKTTSATQHRSVTLSEAVASTLDGERGSVTASGTTNNSSLNTTNGSTSALTSLGSTSSSNNYEAIKRSPIPIQQESSEDSESNEPSTAAREVTGRNLPSFIHSIIGSDGTGSDSQLRSYKYKESLNRFLRKRETSTNRDRAVGPTVNPWDTSYGRCLVFSPAEANGDFKYAAAECGFKQYYVCQMN